MVLSYTSPFKLVAVCLRLSQFPLPRVALVPINGEEDVGVRAGAVHVTCHHGHFVCVSCWWDDEHTQEHMMVLKPYCGLTWGKCLCSGSWRKTRSRSARLCSNMCCLLTYSPGHLPPPLQWPSGFHPVKASQWWCQRAPALSLSLRRPLTWRASAHMGRWQSRNPSENEERRRTG